MKTWAAVSEGVLVGIVFMHAATRLWPKTAGFHYLRYNLSRKGVRGSDIPPECVRELVDDAFNHAHGVCNPGPGPGKTEGRIHYFEFERMLRIHSSGVQAVLTGRSESWDRQRAILARYDLPATTPQAIIEDADPVG